MILSSISYMKVLQVTAILAFTLLCVGGEADVHKNISCVILDGDPLPECKLESFNPMGTIIYKESRNSTGWDTLDITVVPGGEYLSPVLQMYAIGWAEGFVTFKSISDSFDNTMGDLNLTSDVRIWIIEHIAYMEGVAEGKDAYSLQLARLIQQLKGISKGYNDACAASKDFNCTVLDFMQIFLLNFQTEIGDVKNAFNDKSKPSEVSTNNREHCSGLIKPVKDDLFFSHVTWTGFSSMLRQYKTYNLGTGSQYVTMSGYPGVIHSIDDWYMTGARLAVMETTNGVYDTSLFTKYLKDNTTVVSSFLRTMLANYLAQTPKEWVEIWSRHPSGTYNNQWMVLDMKQYTPNKKCPKGGFYVVETVPGTIKSGDMSDVLNKQGYWGSYNLPYFQEIRDLSGVTKLQRERGDFFSYTNYSRARIFKRNHSSVSDMTSMMALMRYNNYKHDNLSLITNCSAATGGKCNPPFSAMLAIASRGDLNPPVPPNTSPTAMYGVNHQFLGQRPHCATDAKIASYKGMMKQGEGSTAVFVASVVSGPTTSNGLPPFDHAESPFAAQSWKGLPTGKWEFPVQNMSVGDLPPLHGDPVKVPVHDVLGLGIGIVVMGGIVVLVTISILIFDAVVKKKDPADYAVQV